MRHRWVFLAVAAIAILLPAEAAMAWGPLTHVRLANEILAGAAVLPAALATLLTRHARFFVFGNIAADVVFAKKLTRVKQLCHQWRTGFRLLGAADDDRERAFCYGYLAHLAADTVAHNKFLPRQMAVSGSTVSFGHLYWEVRADATIQDNHWEQLQLVLGGRYQGPERLLREQLTQTLLPFDVNRRLFERMNRLTCARGWRRSMRIWSRLSRWPLSETALTGYHAESLERVVDILARGPASRVTADDPNGNQALLHARLHRGQVRRLRRARQPFEHLVEAAAARHAPRALEAAVSGTSAAGASPA